MTRGTIYLLLPEKVIESCEFNGDMYEDGGHMDEMVKRLSRVKNEADFKKEITEFDKENFNYQNEENNYFGFNEREYGHFSLVSKYLNKPKIDMRKEKYYKLFFSDYLYFLNLSGKPIDYLDYNGNLGQMCEGITIFNFGTFYKEIKND